MQIARCFLKMSSGRLIMFITLPVLLIVSVKPIIEIVHVSTGSWQQVEVEFMYSEEYSVAVGDEDGIDYEDRYRHYYQGIVNGEVHTFISYDEFSSTGSDQTIIVNRDDSGDYFMYSSKQTLIVDKVTVEILPILGIFVLMYLVSRIGRLSSFRMNP